MTDIDVESAGEGLANLVDRAMTGEDLVISGDGVPVAKLVRLADETAPRRRLGLLEGQITTTPDFDVPPSRRYPRRLRRTMMRLLLDTHILIWALATTARLSDEAKNLISAPGNQIYFSAVSL